MGARVPAYRGKGYTCYILALNRRNSGGFGVTCPVTVTRLAPPLLRAGRSGACGAVTGGVFCL